MEGTDKRELDNLKEILNEKEFSGIVEQKESIKLTRNTKGYGWEIKILSLDINRLEELNNDMKKRFKQDE